MNRKLHITFFIIILSITANINLQKQYDYAKELFNQEKYFEAITEFKRLQFFDEENIYSFESNYKIGVAYKKGGFYDNAIEYLSKANLKTDNFAEKAEIDFQLIRCNILRKTFDRAHQLLDQMKGDTLYSDYHKEIDYWRGWTFMLEDKWDLAELSFAQISDDHELKKLCKEVKNDKYSVTFARVISYILPGAGQFYTGNYFSGFMSLAWNALWGYLTVNSFVEERAFDGIATGALLWLRFYRGNVQNAGKLAEMENIEITNNAFLYLMENYRGEKP